MIAWQSRAATIASALLFLAAILGVPRLACAASFGGMVIRGDTRAPVQGATIHVVREPDGVTIALATTLQDGSFEAGGLAPGYYRLLIQAPGLLDATVDGVTLVEGSDLHLPIPLVLESAFIQFLPAYSPWKPSEFGRVRGVVLEVQGATQRSYLRPAADVLVRAYASNKEEKGESTTDIDGNFTIATLPPGHYTLSVATANGPNKSFTIDLTPGENLFLAQPIAIAPQVIIDDSSFQSPCGRLVRRDLTANTYIVCGD